MQNIWVCGYAVLMCGKAVSFRQLRKNVEATHQFTAKVRRSLKEFEVDHGKARAFPHIGGHSP